MRAKGFTLLELLIAMALLALLTTLLFAGFRLHIQHVDRQAGRLDRASQLPAVHSFLRERLAKAVPVSLTDPEAAGALFEGTPGSLAFVAPAPQSLQEGGLLLFSIGTADGRLVARWRRFDRTVETVARGGEETVLLEQVATLTVRYYGTLPQQARPTWHDQWRAVPYLPTLVRFELEFSDGERMPDLIVLLRIDSPARGASIATPR